jgi:hypothetical protein
MVAKTPDQARAEQAAKDKTRANNAKAGSAHEAGLASNFGGPNPKFYLDFDQYGRFRTLNTQIGESKTPEQRFLYVQPDGVTYSVADVRANEIVKLIRNDFKNNKEGLRKALYDLDYLSEREYKTRSETALNSAILSAANEYTTDTVDSYLVEGKTKFNPFSTWLRNKPSVGKGDGDKNLPVRDINLIDRDVVKAMIKDVYFSELQKEVDNETIEAKTDYYMNQIKSGTLTTVKEGSKEAVRTTTPGFSQARLQAELQPKVKKEFTEDFNQAQSINFLSFLADLGAR